MFNWFANKEKIKTKTINAIMGELNCLVDKESENNSANYWIDQTHNVFAFINDNGDDDDKWIEIHYELHDYEDIIGDLLVLNTANITMEDLINEITVVVNAYYGD